MEQDSWKKANRLVLKGLLSFPLSGCQISGLLVNDLDLLINYLPGKPIDRDMDPVMLLVFNYEVLRVSA
jgi:hypothetical protein